MRTPIRYLGAERLARFCRIRLAMVHPGLAAVGGRERRTRQLRRRKHGLLRRYTWGECCESCTWARRSTIGLSVTPLIVSHTEARKPIMIDADAVSQVEHHMIPSRRYKNGLSFLLLDDDEARLNRFEERKLLVVHRPKI